MNAHNRLHQGHARKHDPQTDSAPSTMVSVVYVTASPTFTGAIGGYSTLGVVVDTSADPSVLTPPSVIPVKSSTNAQTTLKTSASVPTALSSPLSTVPTSLALLAATSSLTNTAASATASASTTSSGMGTAGKAGLAIGFLLGLGAVLALVLFCFKKRRDAVKGERVEDEKHEFATINRQPSVAAAKAPRLSLRPVTQFLPYGERRQSRGNALLVAHPAPINEKRPTTAQSNNRENPFGSHAETIDAANVDGPTVVESVGPAGEIVAHPAAPAAAVGLKRGASKSGPKPMDFTKSGPFMGPPSPAGTEFSVNSESASNSSPPTAMGNAIAAAGGPQNSAVYRVQLDFNPSMGDELDLKAGQLIRLLHEYDDGWAMCIRLDRSQQGVVPRTCLSTRPVKPRPQQNGPRGPPPGMRVPQQQRPGPGPQGQQGPPRSMTPQGGPPRPLTPQGQGQPTRPMTPQGQQGSPRVMTPQDTPQQGRPHAGSNASQQPRLNSPPMNQYQNKPQYPMSTSPPPTGPLPAGPAPVSRKPVPGQAL